MKKMKSNPSDLVCKLGLARRLKGIGIEQSSLFYWLELPGSNPRLFYKEELKEVYALKTELDPSVPDFDENIYSAFTSGELGYLLEDCTQTRRYAGKSFVYLYNELDEIVFYESDENEANARAEMVLTLTNKKLIKYEKTK